MNHLRLRSASGVSLASILSIVSILSLGLPGCGSSSGSPSGPVDASPSGPVDASTDAPSDSGSTSSYVPKGVPLDGTVAGMRFTDPQNGFLLLAGMTPDGRGVWATADGGESWTKRDIDLAAAGVAFTTDLSRLWVVGSYSTVSSLWSSGDRGQSFTPLPSPSSPSSPGGLELMAPNTLFVPAADGTALYRSTDGGASWTKKDFDNHAAERVAVQGRDVWLAGGVSFNPSGAQVTHSTDGGSTWSVTSLTDKAHTFQGGQLLALHVVSATEIWVAGESRQVFHTTDAGGTWKQITGIPDVFSRFGGIDVQGPHVTLAGDGANGYALYTSDDAGASFHVGEQLRCPGVCARVAGVASPTPGVLFVYGDELLWRVTRAGT